jgi:arginyl-tRNA synthetase
MFSIESFLANKFSEAIASVYGVAVEATTLQIQKTHTDFQGDYTLVVFPLLKLSRKKPEETGNDIGTYLVQNSADFAAFNVVKGFLNVSFTDFFWAEMLNSEMGNENFGFAAPNSSGKHVMVEFSSPNTNKPLHLGHIRNNLLGFSVAKILEANGNKVTKVNLVNDRGIHICKSMLAWQRFGLGETPQSSGKKGDHLVGEYYVRFDKEYKIQIEDLKAKGLSEEESKQNAPLMLEAQEMLRQWEAKDSKVISLWETMNGWVYEGFDITYRNLGISFEKVYYESQTYLLGKAIVSKGLEQGAFYRKPDGSVWVDLTTYGLDEKVLLRADGTSVYITQDIGTAVQRFDEFHLDEHIYVVGNEQEYHFNVLKSILKSLGYSWSDYLFHLSYGMVNLPEGKMKSREGTVVDADDLVGEMVETAREMANELGKLEGLSETEVEQVCRIVGLGALKYFILKVDPKKNMTFNPRESIDFNGNTGPFIQYTYARIQSVLRKAEVEGVLFTGKVPLVSMSQKERELIMLSTTFPGIVAQAAEQFSPALVANFVYDLSKEYNQFYQDHYILRETNEETRRLRLQISQRVGICIKNAMGLLGIDVPSRM